MQLEKFLDLTVLTVGRVGKVIRFCLFFFASMYTLSGLATVIFYIFSAGYAGWIVAIPYAIQLIILWVFTMMITNILKCKKINEPIIVHTTNQQISTL